MVTRTRRHTTLEDWLAWFETLHPKKIDMSLERVRVVLERLDLVRPEYAIVTVAGTNGKGSCVAMLESIYWHAGYTVGAFTSPHIWRFNERIRVDGADASDAEIIELFEIIEDARGEITLSYFETSTVAALLHFARRNVDVAVLEVGMGGRLDASNAVAADCALIVSVDLDHQEWLGPDRESIGREKAGIMRPGKPVVIADREPPASVLAHAAAEGAEPLLIGRDFDFVRAPGGWRRTHSSADATVLPLPPFGGDEQLGNAAACAAVVARLRDTLPVADSALAAGIRNATLHGRFERHVRDGIEWIFDVGHNPAAAARLAVSLARLPPSARTLAVFAAMRDKDLRGVVAPLIGSVETWFTAQANAERGATAEELAALLESAGAACVAKCASVADACARAQAAARAGDRVLVFGSFHTVGAATAALQLYSAPSKLGDRPARWTRG